MEINWAEYLPELKLLLVATVTVVILGLAARWIISLIIRLTPAHSFTNDLLQEIRPPLHLLVPLLGLQTVLSSAADDLFFISGYRRITALLIIAAFTWLGLRAVNAAQQVILNRHPINVSDNLSARRIQTQTKVLVQTLCFFVFLFGVSAMLMTFPAARQFGTSLLASAGLAGLAVGFAAKPVLGNLIAGLQLAITQPISLDDVVIIENEWGRIEEITGTYVVIRIWDDRRLIVPLQWFIEHPFQNWTRQTSSITGSIFLWVDYSMALEPLRAELEKLLKSVPDLWDGRVSVLQVTDTSEKTIQLRILVSAADSSRNWDLRCFVREKLINFITTNYPDCLPQLRANMHQETPKAPTTAEQISTPERQPPV